MIDTASALPPEFSADALMDVVESGWVTDKSRRLKLLRHAFEQAALVQQALKKRLAIDAQTDSRSGFQHLAFTLNLDRISLQTRAVNDLLPFDSDKAKDWFDEIRFPELDPIGCDETLVYDPSSYYKTLANLAREAFSRSQKMDGHRFAWLIGHLARIQSHTQIAPIAYELSSADLDLPPRELQDSAALLAAELQTMRGDQQSFSFAVSAPGSLGAIGAVRALLARLGPENIAGVTLVGSLRSYLINNFRDLRCNQLSQSKSDSVPPPIGEFNQEFRVALQNAQLSPIASQEVGEYQTAAPPKSYPLWQSADAKQLLSDLQKLKFGPGGALTPIAERESPTWTSQMSRLVTQLSSWTGNGEPEADVFHEKSEIYGGLIDITPPSPARSDLLHAYVEFLEGTSFKTTSPVEWVFFARRLLVGLKAKDYRAEVLHAFADSRDQTLSLYAQIEGLRVTNDKPFNGIRQRTP